MPKKDRSHDRAPGKTAIAVSMPASLLAEVDECARDENRTRSNFIVTVLIEAVRKRKQEPQERFSYSSLNEDPPDQRAAKITPRPSRRSKKVA